MAMKPILLPKTRRRFEVARDENGVPHVVATTWLDALFGLGYMHALDRGTQLLFSRCVASGRAAEEITGTPEMLETDRFFRRIGLYLDLESEVRLLDDRIFSQLTAYCEGVNDALLSMPRSWAMWATGFELHPWNQQAVLLIGKLLSFGGLAVSQIQNERLLIELIHAGVNEQALQELFAPRLDNVDFSVIRRIKISNQLSDEALEVITDLPRLAGSNAWAVSPRRSATGHALLAADPHLEVNRLPAIWYEAVLRWGPNANEYAMGATLPGCPLFAVARTKQLAWGVTYMKGDTIDHFVEDCRPGGLTGWQYRRDDRWLDFQLRAETLQRKGSSAQVMRVYENEQGVLDGDPDAEGPGLYLSLAWSGKSSGNGQAIATWLEIVASQTAREAMRIARECPQPTLVWVFADREGHIAQQCCGRIPKRGGGQIGLAPIPAWDVKNHWQGWVPTEMLPALFDPPAGYVATANEEINPSDLPWLVTQPLNNYRVRRISERLAELPGATLEDMQQLQYDLVSLQARDLLAVFLPHLPAGPLKDRLAKWDCRYDANSQEAPLFLSLYRNVLLQVFGHEGGVGWRRMVYLCTRVGYSMMVLAAADRLLARDESLWWQGRDKGELIRRAAERTEGQPEQPWSAVNNFHFTDRFFGQHQVGRILGYNSRQYPMPGNHATPFQGHVLQTAKREFTFAPSYHFVTDLGTDEAFTNLPGGPSESRFSKFYKNDLARWFTGEYKRLSGDSAR